MNCSRRVSWQTVVSPAKPCGLGYKRQKMGIWKANIGTAKELDDFRSVSVEQENGMLV